MGVNLLVYKASAGSGKTFTLAVEYMKLLIFKPKAYREILAVTFTNKATAEMKERILSQLYGIAVADKRIGGLPPSASERNESARQHRSRPRSKGTAIPYPRL